MELALPTLARDRKEAWAERSEYWLTRPTPRTVLRSKHERTDKPLILCGHGVSLRVDKGTLLARNGFTHYPQDRETYRYFRGDLNLPPRIIMLDGSGSISFDVLSWLSEQAVSLVRVGWQGDVVSVVGGGGSAFLPDRVQWQIETRNNPTLRLEFCCDLISAKVANAITTLRTTIPDSPARDKAIATGQATIDALRARRVRTVNDVMMAEARAASAYFTAWRGLPLNWRSKNRYPVPQGWLSASSRRTLRDSRSATNRNATHPVNAMLNYAYALLHSQVQAAAVANGYDPRQGIMHESRPDAMALVLDLMEPQRAVVDAKVLKFVAAQTFSGADFVIRDDGVCRLAPQLARRICQTTTAEGFME